LRIAKERLSNYFEKRRGLFTAGRDEKITRIPQFQAILRFVIVARSASDCSVLELGENTR
jgi:hypothetical protein